MATTIPPHSTLQTGRLTEALDSHPGPWIPIAESDRAAVRDQLNRLLTSPLFANSKRSASLLKFVVDCTLDGKTEHLKERTLGVDVFQREPDYDTNRDPVVRTTAVEIRKRIAQYYTAPLHETELRIAIPPGSYAPEFRLPSGWTAPRPLAEPFLPEAHSSPRHASRIWLAALAATLLLAMAALGYRFYPGFHQSDLDRFWNPVMAAPGSVLLLMGGKAPAGSAPETPISVRDLQATEMVAFADSVTLSRIAGTLMMKGKPFHVRRHEAAKLEDLRDGPVVLIGAFNNTWTIKLSDQIRFRFVRDPKLGMRIEDVQNPGDRRWQVDSNQPYREVVEDFALVSRVMDRTTGRLVVIAAGMTKFGTAAAGEFLSDPAYMKEAVRSAPKDWDGKNIQIVISTQLIGESSGPPHIVASYFW